MPHGCMVGLCASRLTDTALVLNGGEPGGCTCISSSYIKYTQPPFEPVVLSSIVTKDSLLAHTGAVLAYHGRDPVQRRLLSEVRHMFPTVAMLQV